jgi:hypothetical protein
MSIDSPSGSLAVRATAAVVLAVLVCVLPTAAWYALLVVIMAFAAWAFLGLTHADDRVGRILGLGLALGHSSTIWFFEDDVRVLVPAQALLPLNALLFTVLRPGAVETAARRAMGIAFTPLWIGLLTYLAVARRAAGADGPGIAVLALALALGGDIGGNVATRSGARDASSRANLLSVMFEIGGSMAGAVVLAMVARAAILPELPPLRAIALGVTGGFFAQIGMRGNDLVVRSLSNGARPARLVQVLSPLLLTSALLYGYTRAFP